MHIHIYAYIYVYHIKKGLKKTVRSFSPTNKTCQSSDAKSGFIVSYAASPAGFVENCQAHALTHLDDASECQNGEIELEWPR